MVLRVEGVLGSVHVVRGVIHPEDAMTVDVVVPDEDLVAVGVGVLGAIVCCLGIAQTSEKVVEQLGEKALSLVKTR